MGVIRIQPKASSLVPSGGVVSQAFNGTGLTEPLMVLNLRRKRSVAGSSTRWCMIIRAGSEPMQCIHLKCHIYNLTKATSALKNKQDIAYQLLRPQIFQVASTGMN
jgi:hypothetical protein